MREVVVTIFRSRLRDEATAEYGVWAERMEALAVTMPGFVSFKTFRADDGERISIVEFASEAAAADWARHPEHREAQKLARTTFYEEFDIMTCVPIRSASFKRGVSE